MLILPESVYEERRRLLREHEAARLTDEAYYAQLLKLDPHDCVSLVGLANSLHDAGDDASAEKYYWRAVESNPCMSSPYLALGQMLHDKPESADLADGLTELGILKYARRDDAGDSISDLLLQVLGNASVHVPPEITDRVRKLPHGEQVSVLAGILRRNRPSEQADVTERLRLLRLIEDLQTADQMDAAMVDTFLAEGPAIAPLLTGVLRAWAQEFLDEGEDNETVLENALGLLGETGTANEIPGLLEFVDLENEVASGASSWAVGRIMERLPEEAAKFFERAIPSLPWTQRLKIAELVIANDRFDPQNRLFPLLSEHVEAMEQEDRESYLPNLLFAMAANPQRGGLSAARAILRAKGNLISRTTRREAEEFLSLLDGIDRTPKEPPYAPTVYEICSGAAVWEPDEDEEMDDEIDDDFLPPPEPIRRRPTPGRNDPCWCNSGKKYKKCHLDSDERENRQPQGEGSFTPGARTEFVKLRQSIGQFLGQAVREREMRDALLEYFGDRAEALPEEEMGLTEWLIHDWIVPRLGHTVLEEFLRQRGPRLTAREREVAQSWSRSFVALYEIQQMKPGVGAVLKEMVSGETFLVHDVSLSRSNAAKWDGLLTRVVPGERGLELAASAQMVPRPQIAALREWLADDRDEQGLAWPEYLKANWPRIRRQAAEIAEDWVEGLQLANSSGEQVLLSKATYEVLDAAKVVEALRRSAELTDDSREDEPQKRFIWLDEKKTVLGSLRMTDKELIFESNSRQRHERGESLLAGLVGGHVRHLRDEFTTQKEMKRRAKESPRTTEPSGSELPEDVRNEILAQIGEKFYVEWLDTSVPALGGLTPRQAAKTAKGRLQLEELLKSVENTEDRKRQRGEPHIEPARMRADLGLD